MILIHVFTIRRDVGKYGVGVDPKFLAEIDYEYMPCYEKIYVNKDLKISGRLFA
jgi:hypothetical protein